MGTISRADYMAMQARLYTANNKQARTVSSEGVDRESDLHNEILDECRRRGWIAFHGSMAHRAMRTLGENDFHCILPGGVVLFVECKTRTGKLSTEQLGIKMWMEKLGHTMHIIRSLNEFVTLCEDALKSGTSSGVSKSFHGAQTSGQ